MTGSQDVGDIISTMHRIAVVGLSPDPERPSHEVAAYLQRQGFEIVPVNPKVHSILGERAYPDLTSIPGALDVVDVFRQSVAVLPIAEEAVRRGGIRTFWMQLGVHNEAAAELLRNHGIAVVQDHCLKLETEARKAR